MNTLPVTKSDALEALNKAKSELEKAIEKLNTPGVTAPDNADLIKMVESSAQFFDINGVC